MKRVTIACVLAVALGCSRGEDAAEPTNVVKIYTVDELIEELKKEDTESRQNAAVELKKQATAEDEEEQAAAKKAIPALVAVLKDKEPGVRTAAAEALVAFGTEGRVAGAPTCFALLKADDEASRKQGQELLAVLSPACISVLDIKDAAKRRETATALVSPQGPELVEAIPLLLEIRKEGAAKEDKDLVQMVDYVNKYGKVDKPEAMPALLAGLNDKDPHVRAGTLVILGRMGAKAKEAVPTLTKIMKDEKDRNVYNDYLVAYKKITGWDGSVSGLGSVNLGDAWKTDFSSFLEQLRFILGPNPRWPTATDEKILSIVSGNTTEFFVPEKYPGGAKFENSTAIFHEKTVEWELTVEGVEVQKETKRVLVHFKPPVMARLQNINPKLKEMASFYATMDDDYKSQALKLTLGQKVTVRADVGHEPLDGIFLLFGVGGKFTDQIHLSVRLRKAQIIR